MRKRDVLSLIYLLSFSVLNATCAVTLYNTPGQAALGQGQATSTTTAVPESYTGAGLGAYDPTVLQPPPIPNPPPPTNFGIQLQAGGTPGLSIKQQGNFLGFSIEFSVVTQVSEWNFSIRWPHKFYINSNSSWQKCVSSDFY